MNIRTALLAPALLALSALVTAPTHADEQARSCQAAVDLFRGAGESARFFRGAYGWAVFPTVGKGGFGVGGAYGRGCVYARGALVGESSLAQLSVGFQAGGQAYSQIVFFEDKRAFDEFTSGTFEFGAGVAAVAITAGANAQASTAGTSAGASGTERHARTAGGYVKGMAVFTIVKGGLMYEASVAGQKFKYEPLRR